MKPIEIGKRSSFTLLQTALLSPTDVLRNEYVSKLMNGHLAARFWLMNGRRDGNLTTLDFIPQRLGESIALDHAVECICSPPLGDGDTTPRMYLQALKSLQTALDDRCESMKSGTLAAATLLYIHEIFLNPFQRSWQVHAEGVIRLLEVRGPGSFITDLDRSILCGQVGTIFLDAIQQRKRCFLAEADWNVLLRQLLASGPGVRGDAGLTPNIVVISVYLPGFICRYEELSTAASPIQTQELMEDICTVRQQLHHWRIVNDIEPEIQVYEQRLMSASAASLKPAFQMSAVIFLVLTGYMHADLLCSEISRIASVENDGSYILEEELANLLEQCTRLVSIAKTKWQAVKQSDAVSAWAAVTPNTLMLHRVLKVPCANNAKMSALRADTEDLYNSLCQDE